MSRIDIDLSPRLVAETNRYEELATAADLALGDAAMLGVGASIGADDAEADANAIIAHFDTENPEGDKEPLQDVEESFDDTAHRLFGNIGTDADRVHLDYVAPNVMSLSETKGSAYATHGSHTHKVTLVASLGADGTIELTRQRAILKSIQGGVRRESLDVTDEDWKLMEKAIRTLGAVNIEMAAPGKAEQADQS